MPNKIVALFDLSVQQQRLRPAIEAAVRRVLDHGQYIMGPEVAQLETELAQFCGAAHAITCGNGTDAMQMVLMAAQIGPGDAVFVPAFTFVATAEAVALVGATPFFVDVCEGTCNIDVVGLREAIGEANASGLRPRAVIAVDLFGQPADYDSIRLVAEEHRLLVIADAAQSFGGSLGGRMVGSLAHVTTTSFFPSKPLGCYGDGGAIFTNDANLADSIRSIRLHGKGRDKYDNVRVGVNSRLDTLQAAILLQKLVIFREELELRRQIAERYTAALSNIVGVPREIEAARSAWALYTITSHARDRIAQGCEAAGIATAIYYRTPLHQQVGYSHFPAISSGCSVSQNLSSVALSLPFHPYLSTAAQDRVIETVQRLAGSEIECAP